MSPGTMSRAWILWTPLRSERITLPISGSYSFRASMALSALRSCEHEADTWSVPTGPSKPPHWNDNLRAWDGAGSRRPCRTLAPGRGHTKQPGDPKAQPTPTPPTCHTPTIALATRISMMTRGSTKAVVVSSPSSNQARICRD